MQLVPSCHHMYCIPPVSIKRVVCVCLSLQDLLMSAPGQCAWIMIPVDHGYSSGTSTSTGSKHTLCKTAWSMVCIVYGGSTRKTLGQPLRLISDTTQVVSPQQECACIWATAVSGVI